MIDMAGGSAQLLPLLQPLQQMTFLCLALIPNGSQHRTPLAAAYATLTASSKLQHLSLSFSRLPAGTWHHLFLAGRQLPQLRYLDISRVRLPDGTFAPAPTGSLIVSCCPVVENLMMLELPCSTEVLAPLTALSMLNSLGTDLSADDSSIGEIMDALCQLTGLSFLALTGSADALLLPLTQLEQLASLHYQATPRWAARGVHLVCTVS